MSSDSKINNKTIRRKVQVVGGNTITVSLPRSWADRNQLGRGPNQEQEIAMRYMADGSLLLSPANTNRIQVERKRTHRITVNTSIDQIKRIIIADFMGGIDMIKLRTKADLDVNFIHGIRDFVDKRLIGFDLIDTENGFDIINMTQSPKFAVERMLEIIRVQSTQMMEKCYGWLVDPSIDKIALKNEISMLESSLDKRSNQMIRTLQLSILDHWMAENVGLPMAEILYWSSTTKAAENASDLAVAITEVAQLIDLDTVDKKDLEEMHTLGEKITDLYTRAMKAFIDHDYEMAHLVLEQQNDLSATTQARFPISQVSDLSGPMILLLRHLEKISVYARKIAEAAIDCEAARVAYNASGMDD